MASFIVNLEYVSMILGSAPWNIQKEEFIILWTYAVFREMSLLYFSISQQKWTYKSVIKTLELIAHIEIASFPNDILNASHKMIHKLEKKKNAYTELANMNEVSSSSKYVLGFVRTLSCILSFMVGFLFDARLTFNNLTNGFIVIPWTNTVK